MPKPPLLTPPDDVQEAIVKFLKALIFEGHGAAVTLPIRTREGIRGIGFHGLYAVIVTFYWAAFYPCPPLLYYAAFLAALLVVKRACSLGRHHFGFRQISDYPGYPALVLLLVPFASEGVAKAILEPLLIAAAGMVTKDYCRGVGMFLLAGAAFSAYRGLMDWAVTAASDLAEADAHELARQRAARKQRRGLWG